MKRVRRICLVLLALLVLLWLSPAQPTLVKAVLLGPNVLVPQEPPHTLTLVEHGPRSRRVVHVVVRPGTVLQGWITSPALHAQRESYLIYLPPGYSDPANAGRRYPALYLLHGAPGQPSDWTDGAHVNLLADQMIALGQMRPLIMVMPEGNGGVWHDSQYVDGVTGFAAETYLTRDVVHFVDTHYRTIPDRRYRTLMGISEGGYGAVNLALKHHDEFGIAVSIGGYFTAPQDEVFGLVNPFDHDARLEAANDPMRYVWLQRGPRDVRLLIADNPSDGHYNTQALAFARELAALGISYRLLIQSAPPLLGHYWPYWHKAIPLALIWVSQNFGH
jgi:S-formylglutathione hydrolase FrmB